MRSTEIAWVSDSWRPVAHAVRLAATVLPVTEIDFVFAHVPFRLQPKHEEKYEQLRVDLGDWSSARAHVWLERINWRTEPPDELFDAVERLVDGIRYADPTLQPDLHIRRIRAELQRCGYTLDGDPLSVLPVVGQDWQVPSDATGITANIRRLRASIATAPDPHAAVGHAKDLVEATAKYVIGTRGESVAANESLPHLTARAQKLAGVHPSDIEDDVLKRLCGMARQQAEVLGYVRNHLLGATGHGSPTHHGGIEAHHARLVAEAACGWCRFVMDAAAMRQSAAGPSNSGTTVPIETGISDAG